VALQPMLALPPLSFDSGGFGRPKFDKNIYQLGLYKQDGGESQLASK